MSQPRRGHNGFGDDLSAEALGEMFEGYRGMVVAVCTGVLGRSHLVADAVQEVFLKLLLSARDIRNSAKLGHWLGTVARNTATDLLRAERRRLEPNAPRPVSDPLHTLVRDESHREVLDSVMALEPDFREVILLRYLYSSSYREIADTLGVSVSTVETRLHRARKQLEGRLRTRR
jgi:RNA polymerase sigma-70 factor, ECF subfamily